MSYPEHLRCQDCGRHHQLDATIPSEVWNKITTDGASLLCVDCIDARALAAGVTFEVEFYWTGKAGNSKLYSESCGDMASASLASAGEELVEELRPLTEFTDDDGQVRPCYPGGDGRTRERIVRAIDTLARQQAEIASLRDSYDLAINAAKVAEAERNAARERVEKAEGERDEARLLVTEANNSLYGSQGYFHSLDGGPFDAQHLATGIERLKAGCRQLQAAEASERRALSKISELAHKLKAMEDRTFTAEARVAELTRALQAARVVVEAEGARATLALIDQALTAAQGEEPAPDHTAAIREAMEALEPFAREADNWGDDYPDRKIDDLGISDVTLDDCRRARAVHAKLTEIIEGGDDRPR